MAASPGPLWECPSAHYCRAGRSAAFDRFENGRWLNSHWRRWGKLGGLNWSKFCWIVERNYKLSNRLGGLSGKYPFEKEKSTKRIHSNFHSNSKPTQFMDGQMFLKEKWWAGHHSACTIFRSSRGPNPIELATSIASGVWPILSAASGSTMNAEAISHSNGGTFVIAYSIKLYKFWMNWKSYNDIFFFINYIKIVYSRNMKYKFKFQIIASKLK